MENVASVETLTELKINLTDTQENMLQGSLEEATSLLDKYYTKFPSISNVN